MKMCREPSLGCWSSLCVCLGHPDTPVLGLLCLLIHNSSFALALFSAVLSCFLWTLSCCLKLLMRALQILLRLHMYPLVFICVCVLSRIKKKLAACLLFFIRMVRNVLGSPLYTQTVWPHVRKRRQHSSCYRYASVRVVMVAAQPEISSCYLRSAENLINTTKLTRPNLNDLQATHEGIALLHVCICL